MFSNLNPEEITLCLYVAWVIISIIMYFDPRKEMDENGDEVNVRKQTLTIIGFFFLGVSALSGLSFLIW